jgi:hypothetical protein
MEEAPSRLHHISASEAFTMRSFQPPLDTRFYAGVDLHTRSLFLVVLDTDGTDRMNAGYGSSTDLGPPAPAAESNAGSPRSCPHDSCCDPGEKAPTRMPLPVAVDSISS